jgi:Tol biopolymer transport system component
MKAGLFGMLVLCVGLAVVSTGDAPDESTTDYIDQTRPGLEPRIFAKGIVSTAARELNSVFSPDGDLFLFTRRDESQTYRIMETRHGHKGWSAPSVATFSAEHGGVDPAVSWDGKRVFFGSGRPGTLGDSDIWVVDLMPDARWGEPRNLGSPVNTPGNENHAAPARDGTLYFHSAGHPGLGESDIFRAAVSGDGYSTPVNLGPDVNSEASDFDPFVAPDQSFVIFSSYREGGFGAGDLHVSFRTEDGGWTRAVNLGEAVNTSDTDYCPKVTPDGKYLFYTSRSTGEGDVYWVDARIIDRYRPGAR